MTGLARLCLAPADNSNQKESIRQNAATATRTLKRAKTISVKKKQGTLDIGEV